MISVRNPLQQLSGNKRFIVFACISGFLLIQSCIPRSEVVKPVSEPVVVAADTVVVRGSEEQTLEEEVFVPKVALLLPFQLNRSAGNRPGDADVKRAELALDFYQGFEMGLKRVAEKGISFQLDVLDTRDDEWEVQRLARTPVVQEADLVVGPVFPKSIKAFGQTAGLTKKGVIQISPLAAAMPSEFNLSNLLSVTSPLITHVKAIAQDLDRQLREGDAVILYRTDESSSQQFLPALKTELRLLKSDRLIYEVENEEQLGERLLLNGENVVVCGSSNRFRIVSILNELNGFLLDGNYRIRIVGHPNWAKISIGSPEILQRLKASISSSYHIDAYDSETRQFSTEYRAAYRVEPSEYAFKGYDIACFVGYLLEKFGENFADHLLDEPYRGLHNGFELEYHPDWGYVNSSIQFLEFRNGAFVSRQP